MYKDFLTLTVSTTLYIENLKLIYRFSPFGTVSFSESREDIQFCDWIGTIAELPDHLQNDCKYTKMNCPLHDLNPELCDVCSQYPHQLKSHLEQSVVGHWQLLTGEINELKSVQLSLSLKLQSVACQSPKSPPLQPVAATGGEPISSPRGTTGTTPRETLHELLQNQSNEFQNEIRKLWADSMAYRDRMGSKLIDLNTESKRKDNLIASLSNQLNLMQKEIENLKKDKV